MLCNFLESDQVLVKGEYVHKTSMTCLKKTLLLILPMIMVYFLGGISQAYSNMPEQVRIGLFFNDDKTKQYTAVSSFTVDAGQGLEMGNYKDNSFSVLMTEATSSAVTIRKDDFFVYNNGSLTGYNPASTSIPSGKKIGSYHVKIGGDYPDYNALAPKLEEIRQKGIEAYPAFTGTWQIWCGFYLDENDAQMSVMYTIDPLLGTKDYSVIAPSPTRIVALSGSEQVKLMYDSVNGVFQVYPGKENSPYVFRINGDSNRLFRGGLEVRRQTGSDMTVINILPTEQYLYGVVPREIEASSHVEALKAQAVAARTYTLNNLWKYSHLNFNLCTTQYSQVYKGFSVEHPSTNKAVDDTKGKIVTYNGKPAAVFYFSSSGGKTEDVKNVWGSDGYPYLKSVDDSYESGKSWHYNWQVSFTAQKITEIMTGRGFKLGNIIGVQITKRSEAGRAIELIVKGTADQRIYTNSGTRAVLSLDSQWYDITTDSDVSVMSTDGSSSNTQLSGKKVMTSAGLKTINTANKNISIISSDNTKKSVPAVPTIYTFTGRGWGHGVGMSQEGAKGLANAGFKYDEILTHYFTGTKVE